MSHGGDHWNGARRHGAHNDLVVEAPEVLQRAAAAGDDDDVRLPRHGIETGDGRCHLCRAGLALHAHRPNQHVAGEALVESMEDVADHSTRGRGDDADELRQVGNGLLPRGIKQPLRREPLPALLQQRHQRAHARGLDVLDHDLVVRLHRVGGDLAGGDHLETLLHLGAEPAEAAAPDHRVELGALVLDGEIAVAGCMGATEARDLAPHPDMAERVLEGSLQGVGDLGYRVLADIGLAALDDLARFGVMVPDGGHGKSDL